jgi:hypothetical protein
VAKFGIKGFCIGLKSDDVGDFETYTHSA